MAVLDRCRSMKAQQPKEPRRNGHPEEDLQIKCVAWFREHYPNLAHLLFHPYNGVYFGKGRTKGQQERAGKHAKDLGVTPGVADLILLLQSGNFNALCIEMKTKTGTQEPVQKEWQNLVTQYGSKYVVCRSLEAFQELIRDYTKIEPLDKETAAVVRIFGRNVRVRK